MRKRVIDHATREPETASPKQPWLDLEALADVEVSSENPAYPIESALIPGAGSGWRAEHAGQQTIRLEFHQPQAVGRINLVFQEHERPRSQEFLLRWSSDKGHSYREIVRQQYNFSPPETTSEREDYNVDLAGLTTLELVITPDVNDKTARASLDQLLLA